MPRSLPSHHCTVLCEPSACERSSHCDVPTNASDCERWLISPVSASKFSAWLSTASPPWSLASCSVRSSESAIARAAAGQRCLSCGSLAGAGGIAGKSVANHCVS